MISALNIRKAQESDIQFLIETIIEAEKSGTDKNAYCTLFSLNEDEFKNILKEILLEDIQGQELCISDFLIAEVDGRYAGACCGWIEAKEGNTSASLKTNILYHFLGEERIQKAIPKLKIIEDIQFEKEAGCLQLECVYVKSEFRGQGIVQQLFSAHFKKNKQKFPEFKKAQIILAKTNDTAYKAYFKWGFQLKAEKFSESAEILRFLPANSRILMEKLL